MGAFAILTQAHIHRHEIIGNTVWQEEVFADVILAPTAEGFGGFPVFQEAYNPLCRFLRGLVKVAGIAVSNLEGNSTDIG